MLRLLFRCELKKYPYEGLNIVLSAKIGLFWYILQVFGVLVNREVEVLNKNVGIFWRRVLQ